MSGGHYDYAYCLVSALAEAIEQDADTYAVQHKNEYGDMMEPLPANILEGMRRTAATLKAAAAAAHDIEWYLSGDYGEETLRLAMAKWGLSV